MDVVEIWSGRHACTLQAALRMTNEAFAERLGIAQRTVATWHTNPAVVPRAEMQQLLDQVYETAAPAVRRRFALLASSEGTAAVAGSPRSSRCASLSPSSSVRTRRCWSADGTTTLRASPGNSRPVSSNQGRERRRPPFGRRWTKRVCIAPLSGISVTGCTRSPACNANTSSVSSWRERPRTAMSSKTSMCCGSRKPQSPGSYPPIGSSHRSWQLWRKPHDAREC